MSKSNEPILPFPMRGAGGVGRSGAACTCTSHKSEGFSYHDPLDVDTAQRNFLEDRIEPTNGVTTGPYEFVIEPSDDAFLCLGSTYLTAEIQLLNRDGSNIENEKSNVACVNNMLASLWETIDVKLNNVTINPSSAYHKPYKSMLENVLSYEDEKYFQLKAGGFFSDRFPHGMDTGEMGNASFKLREKMTENSKSCLLSGPLCVDFLRSDNHLAPGNKLALTLHRTSDEFYVNRQHAPLSSDTNTVPPTPTEYRVKILNLNLYVRRVQLHGGTQLMSKILRPRESMRHIAPYTEVKTFPIASGRRQWSDVVYGGDVLPKHIIVGMIDTDAFTGSFDSNPFRFNHYDLASINVKVNGICVPKTPLTPNFERGHFGREYWRLFQQTGKINQHTGGNLIDRSDFSRGYTLFPFDFSPDLCNGGHFHLGQGGRLELDLSWRKPLPSGITVIVYSTFDQVIAINPTTGIPNVNIF